MDRVFIGVSYAGDSVQSARPTSGADPPSDIGAHTGGRDVHVLQDAAVTASHVAAAAQGWVIAGAERGRNLLNLPALCSGS
jgi:hypothetical protein